MDEVRMCDQIRGLEHEMFGEAQSTLVLIRVCVRVGDIPEAEIVNINPTADMVETLRCELGIEGAAFPPCMLPSLNP